MEEVLTPALRKRFLRFNEAYHYHRDRLTASGASGSVIARDCWTLALRDEFLSLDELKRYKMLVALHSVNGGELFALGPLADLED